MEGAGHSVSFLDFCENVLATRRQCVGLPQWRLFETAVIWEHFERYSGRAAVLEPETSTPDHAESSAGAKRVPTTVTYSDSVLIENTEV